MPNNVYTAIAPAHIEDVGCDTKNARIHSI